MVARYLSNTNPGLTIMTTHVMNPMVVSEYLSGHKYIPTFKTDVAVHVNVTKTCD